MKKILILATAILTVSFMSCSKDKDKDGTDARLIGEWALLSNVENGVDTKGICGEYSYTIFTEKEVEIHTFKEKTGCSEEVIRKMSYTVSNNKITLEINGGKNIFSYVVNGDILTMTSENNGVVITYKKNARKTPPSITEILTGTWLIQTLTNNGELETLNECTSKTTYTFTDKTLKGVFPERKNNSSECKTEEVNFTYTISKNKLIATRATDNKTIESSFSIEGDILTIEGFEDTNEYVVITLKKQ